MPWARASSLHRYLNCPASCTLPRLERGTWQAGYLAEGVVGVPDMYRPRQQTGMTYFSTRDGSRGEPLGELAKAAEWMGTSDFGTQLHAAKAGLPCTEGARATMEPWREKLWPSRLGKHEVGVAYSSVTRLVEVLEGTPDEVDGWKATKGSDWCVGSVDWWASLPVGEPWIDDLKTGWQEPDTVTEQTTFYVMCRRLYLHQTTSERWPSGRISVTHYSRRLLEQDPGASPTRRWARLSAAALTDFQEQLDLAYVRATKHPQWASSGIQCLYCPSALVCKKGNE